jgi:phenylpropionate dioxygenase-like ring-hydroxylating dioxygenase large terminal subunit
MFIRNSWYVAAWSEDVTAQGPLGRTILDEPVVLFRTADGKVNALEGRCAHRGMPLSFAKLDGDSLVCCYHGLTYNAAGACTRVPGQPGVPEHIKLKKYPAAERYGAVWIWMGEPALADPATIFRCELIDDDGGNGHKYYFHVKSSYLYINDNLSDLLHQAYLHSPSFGGNTEPLGETVPQVTEEGDRIRVNWNYDDVVPPGMFAELGGLGSRADGWNHSLYQVPSFYINSVGFANAGTGRRESPLPQGAGKLTFTVHQLITPETASTTHFFKIAHMNWPAELLPNVDRVITPVNLEDIWACEEQQKMDARVPDATLSLLPTDKAVAAMRRAIGERYAEEGRAAR